MFDARFGFETTSQSKPEVAVAQEGNPFGDAGHGSRLRRRPADDPTPTGASS
jgi:hypothetical protein